MSIQPENEGRTIFAMVFIGLMAGLSKYLTSGDAFSWRMVIGRTILGGITSMSSGMALTQFQSLGLVELCGLASIIGILGHQGIEILWRKYADTPRNTK